MNRTSLAIAVVIVLGAFCFRANADSLYPGVGYYVARDANPTLGIGGDPNPNFGRLTLLYNHGDHFHSIGRFGGGANQIPESYLPADARITLFQGTGDMAGRFVSQPYNDGSAASEYSDLRIDSIRNLGGFESGSAEDILFRSSSSRWVSGPEHPAADLQLSLEGSLVALEVVELSQGLHASIGDQVASATGDVLELGAGDSFSSLLSFFTDAGIGMGTNLSATFRLIDLSAGGPIGSSGDIRFEMRTIPEPSTVIMVGLGLTGVIGLRWRRRRRLVLN